MPRITREFIEQHRTAKGGFTFAQCKALGAGWPPLKGWLNRAVLIDHTPEAIALFVEFSSRGKTKQERRVEREHRRAAVASIQSSAVIVHAAQKRPKKKHVAPKLPPLQCDPASDEFLFSFQWRSVRMQALKLYGARCQCCGASPSDGSVMNVDHIKPRRLFPHLALDLDNLQVLCHECNHGKGNWDQTDWRREDVDKDVVSMLRDIAKYG